MVFIVVKYCVFHFPWSRGVDGEMVKRMSLKSGFLDRNWMLGVSGDVIVEGLWFLRVDVECLCLMCSL